MTDSTQYQNGDAPCDLEHPEIGIRCMRPKSDHELGGYKKGVGGFAGYPHEHWVREPRKVTVEDIHDPNFTGGLSPVEYLDRLREGILDD